MRDGWGHVRFLDGQTGSVFLGRDPFADSSVIDSTTYLPSESALRVKTIRGDEIELQVPLPGAPAPVADRPTVYLDQNHWSTLSNAIHQPDRIRDAGEREGADRLVQLARDREVVLPLSVAHMTETCQQHDREQRYRRALTMAQLSAGWHLRDPLDVRMFEIRQSLTQRYHGMQIAHRLVVTLEPVAMLNPRRGAAGADLALARDVGEELAIAHESMVAVTSSLDVMLGTEQVSMNSVPGWATSFMDFAAFLDSDPAGPEMKRRRTHAKFISDVQMELVQAVQQAGIAPAQLSDWTLTQSEDDIRALPSLGLYREVMHEKLCNPTLRWEENDLTDMMFLTVGAGYCDHVVAERSHAAHLRRAQQRLGRPDTVQRHIRGLVEKL